MGTYDVNVKRLCTYTIEAESKEAAIIQAIDNLFNDDQFYCTEATEDDCEIVWYEEDYTDDEEDEEDEMIGTRVKVLRGYITIHVVENEDGDIEDDEWVIERAKYLFESDVYDRCVDIDEMEWEVVDEYEDF